MGPFARGKPVIRPLFEVPHILLINSTSNPFVCSFGTRWVRFCDYFRSITSLKNSDCGAVAAWLRAYHICALIITLPTGHIGC